MQYSKRDVKKLYKRLSKSAGRYSTKMKNLHGIAIRERRRFKLRVDDRTLALVVMGVRRWRVGLERRAKPGEKLAHKREAYERCSMLGTKSGRVRANKARIRMRAMCPKMDTWIRVGGFSKMEAYRAAAKMYGCSERTARSAYAEWCDINDLVRFKPLARNLPLNVSPTGETCIQGERHVDSLRSRFVQKRADRAKPPDEVARGADSGAGSAPVGPRTAELRRLLASSEFRKGTGRVERRF